MSIEKLVERLQRRISGEPGFPDQLLIEVRDTLQSLHLGAKAWKPMVRGLEAQNASLHAAVVAFRTAKDWVASDAYDGIDPRGRELLEEADEKAKVALDARSLPKAEGERGATPPKSE